MLKNSIAVILQTIVFALSQFIFYKLLYQHEGIEQVGLWGLISSVTVAASIGSFGTSGSSVVKYVAMYRQSNQNDKIREVIATSLLFNTVSSSIICILIYFISSAIFRSMLSPDLYSEAIYLLRYALLNYMIYSVCFLFWSVIDGFQQYILRCIWFSALQICLLFLVFLLVPMLHLKGAFIAQIIQNTVLSSVGWVLIKRRVAGLHLRNLYFSRQIFSQLFGYGVHLQAISLTTLFFEPATKFILSKYCGLAFTGYFEMANKLTGQIRNLINASLQPIVPVVASLYKGMVPDADAIKEKYITSIGHVFQISMLLISLMLIMAPVVSFVWIGNYNQTFIHILAVLAVGSWFNMLTLPAYFINFGTGELKFNVVQEIIHVVLNISLLTMLGMTTSSSYLIFSLPISYFAGFCYLVYNFHKKYNVSNKTFFERYFNRQLFSIPIALFTLLIILHLSNMKYNEFMINIFSVVVALSLVYLLFHSILAAGLAKINHLFQFFK